MNHLLAVALLASLLSSGPLWAESQRPTPRPYEPTDSDIVEKWKTRVIPFVEQTEAKASFRTRDGTQIVYRSYLSPAAKDTIVILPGYSESSMKYYELDYDFSRHGYSVFILDHRGMGESQRKLKNPQIVHIDRFDQYVEDAEEFMDRIVLPQLQKIQGTRPRLFAHSTGALVAARLMARRPELFASGALASPLFKLNTGYIPNCLASDITQLQTFIGRGELYSLGRADFDPEKYHFYGNGVTNSRVRFALYRQTLIDYPIIRMGGPSYHWIQEVLSKTTAAEIRKLAKLVKIPIVIFQATLDKVVCPEHQNLFVKACRENGNSKCLFYVIDRAEHEIWRCADEQRDALLKQTLDFFIAN